jgi:hypothetical protein
VAAVATYFSSFLELAHSAPSHAWSTPADDAMDLMGERPRRPRGSAAGGGKQHIRAALVSYAEPARLSHGHPTDGIDIRPQRVHHGVMTDSDVAKLPVVAGKEVPAVLRQVPARSIYRHFVAPFSSSL